MSSRFVHVVANDRISLFFYGSITFHCIYISLNRVLFAYRALTTSLHWKCGAGGICMGGLPPGGSMCEWGAQMGEVQGRLPQQLRGGLPDAVLEMASRIHVPLTHSWLWQLFSQPLPDPRLFSSPQCPGWGRKEVGPFGSTLYSWESWALTHMLSLSLVGEIAGERHWAVPPWGGGNMFLLPSSLHLISAVFAPVVCWNFSAGLCSCTKAPFLVGDCPNHWSLGKRQ